MITPQLIARLKAAAEAGLKAAALQAITMITRRTRTGIDARGVPFKPYSKRYAKLRKESGHNAAPPDLTITGDMLKGISLLRIEQAGTIRRAVLGWAAKQHRVQVFHRAKAKTYTRKGVALPRKTMPVRKQVNRTVPMATVVTGLQRHRRFFDIVLPSEKARLVRIIKGEFRIAAK